MAPSPASFLRAPAPPCADRDPSRVLMQADAASDGKRRRRHGGDDVDDSRASKKQAVGGMAAHPSCARIRPFPKAKGETHAGDNAQEAVTKKRNTGESIFCKKIKPAVPAWGPKKETSSSTQVSARVVGHGVSTKPKAGENISCSRIRPATAVQASGGLKDKMKAGSASILRNDAHGVINTKQEAGERVRATVTTSIPQIRPPAPAANHQDPSAPQDPLRAALAAARQAQNKRQNVYRRQREKARQELDKVVQTVYFNDPYIALEDVLKP